MAPKRRLIGSVAHVAVRLSDPTTGDPDDPATQDPVDDPTLSVTAYKPDGTTANLSMVHGSTGNYSGDITLDQEGVWKFASLSTGAAAGAGPVDGPAEVLVRAVP